MACLVQRGTAVGSSTRRMRVGVLTIAVEGECETIKKQMLLSCAVRRGRRTLQGWLELPLTPIDNSQSLRQSKLFQLSLKTKKLSLEKERVFLFVKLSLISPNNRAT